MQVNAIDPAKTAMIVVDMQNDFVATGAPMETPAARAMVPKIAEALKICRNAAIRVIYTAHVQTPEKAFRPLTGHWSGREGPLRRHWGPGGPLLSHNLTGRRADRFILAFPCPSHPPIR